MAQITGCSATRGICLVLLLTLTTGGFAIDAGVQSKGDFGSTLVRRLLTIRRGRSLKDDASAPAPGPMAEKEGEEYEPVTPRSPAKNPTIKMQSATEETEVYAPGPGPAKAEEEEVYETVVPAKRPAKVIYTVMEDAENEVYAPGPAPKEAEEEGEYEPVKPKS